MKSKLEKKMWCKRLNEKQKMVVEAALAGDKHVEELLVHRSGYSQPADTVIWPSVTSYTIQTCDGSCDTSKSLKTQIKGLLDDIGNTSANVGELEEMVELLKNDVSGSERAALWKSEALRFKARVEQLESQLS